MTWRRRIRSRTFPIQAVPEGRTFDVGGIPGATASDRIKVIERAPIEHSITIEPSHIFFQPVWIYRCTCRRHFGAPFGFPTKSAAICAAEAHIAQWDAADK